MDNLDECYNLDGLILCFKCVNKDEDKITCDCFVCPKKDICNKICCLPILPFYKCAYHKDL